MHLVDLAYLTVKTVVYTINTFLASILYSEHGVSVSDHDRAISRFKVVIVQYNLAITSPDLPPHPLMANPLHFPIGYIIIYLDTSPSTVPQYITKF